MGNTSPATGEEGDEHLSVHGASKITGGSEHSHLRLPRVPGLAAAGSNDRPVLNAGSRNRLRSGLDRVERCNRDFVERLHAEYLPLPG